MTMLKKICYIIQAYIFMLFYIIEIFFCYSSYHITYTVFHNKTKSYSLYIKHLYDNSLCY
jgi:hypothetical protein